MTPTSLAIKVGANIQLHLSPIWIDWLTGDMILYSSRLVPPALSARHASQPAISPDLPAFADLFHRRLPVCPVRPLADVAVRRDAPRGVAVAAPGGAFSRDSGGLAAARHL